MTQDIRTFFPGRCALPVRSIKAAEGKWLAEVFSPILQEKCWAGSYTLPSDVVLLGGFAFDSCKFTEIHIPARVLDLDYDSMASLGDTNTYYAFDSIKDSCKLYVVKKVLMWTITLIHVIIFNYENW